MDNESIQKQKSSQNTDQNNQCVSGDSTVFSCNSSSSENMGNAGPGQPGPQGHKVLQVIKAPQETKVHLVFQEP